MLNKLLKHEFIATGRIMGIVYAVVVLIMGYVLGSYFINRDEASVGQMLGISVLMIISMCMFVLTVVVMVTNFQKSLYGDQGYLSFTLPVKSVSLLTSKVITSTVWFIAAFACFMGTMALTFFVVKEDMLGDNYETIESLMPMLLGGKSLGTIVVYVACQLISLFIRFAMFTIEVYFAISLANTRLFQKRYLLWTVIFSFATIFVSEKIAQLISEAIEFEIAVTEDSLKVITNIADAAMGAMTIDITTIIVSLLIGAGFFYGTFYVMSKKVNIR